MKIKMKLQSLYIRFRTDIRGEFGIKQIAITLAVILVLGFAVTMITGGGLLSGWITWVWNKFTALLDKYFS